MSDTTSGSAARWAWGAALTVPLALVLAAPAAASTLTITVGPVFASAPGDGATSVLLPQFDPALGTLVDATVFVEAVWGGAEARFDNEDPGPVGTTLVFRNTLTATVAGSPTELVSELVAFHLFDADSDGAPDFVGPDWFSLGGGGPPAAQGIPGSPLAAFVGTGSVTVGLDSNLSLETGFAPYPTGPIATLLAAAGIVDWTVQAQYTYLPEPEGGLLLGVGLVGLWRCGRGRSPRARSSRPAQR